MGRGRTTTGLVIAYLIIYIHKRDSYVPKSLITKNQEKIDYFSQNYSQHDFQETQFTTPTWCSICGDFIWGIMKQGYVCKG